MIFDSFVVVVFLAFWKKRSFAWGIRYVFCIAL